MDDFEWIEKDELIERKDDAVRASELCHVPEAVSGTAHDMPTQEVEMKPLSGVTEEEQPAEDFSTHEDTSGENECLRAMEQELDDDLCILNIHHLVLLGRIARQLGMHVRSWAHESWQAMRESLHDGMADDVMRSHGVSFAAAAVTLIVSLLLVHRQDHSSMLSSPMPNSMVSIARSGALCNPLPAAVLALVHNFTAVQSMQESLPVASSVLDAHAKDTKEHFELAKSLFRKGSSEKHVHGHRARALQRRAAKELKKTSKWAVRELRSLKALHRTFLYDTREAIRLERDALETVEERLASLVNALSEKDLYVLRRILRSLSHTASRSEAALEAMRGSYRRATKGIAYVSAALGSHWERVGAALQSAVEGDLASRKASLEALALSACLPSLEEQLEGDLGAPLTDPPCTVSTMDALVVRLQTTLAFQQRLLKLVPAKAGLADVSGSHRAAVAACERSGGLAIALQRRHADLAALTRRHQAATAA